MALNLFCNIINFVLCVMIIRMAFKLRAKSVELSKVTARMRKLEHLYKGMAQDLQNMVDAMVLLDPDGVAIFYQKIQTQHEQFMAIGDDKEDTI